MATKNENTDVDTSVLIIPMGKIVAKLEDNARKVMRDIGKLAGDIKQEGQLTPLLAQEIEGGKYRLRAGFRRFAALRMNKAKVARVQLYEGDEKACDLMNLKENIAREDLTTYELAWACLRMKEKHKMSGPKIADALRGMKGMGKAYVNRLMACMQKGPDYVVTAWADPDNPAHGAATIENMEKVISLQGSPDKAAQKWAEYCGLGVSPGSGGGGGADPSPDPDPPKPPKKLKVDEMSAAMDAVKAAVTDGDITAEEAEGAVGVLKWAMGKVKSLRIDGVTVYDPAKAEKEAKKAKEEEKAEAKAAKEEEKKKKKAARLKAELAELNA